MPIMDFIKGQFIDVIEWTDDSRDTLVHRFERYGNEIKYGAKLTVREGQAAVFVHEGQLADVFLPGMYMLETNNMPIMTAISEPVLTPLFSKMNGMPQRKPRPTKNTDKGKNMRIGLNNMTMFKISFTVSTAVIVLIVLSPPSRSEISISSSSTRFFSCINTNVITSLNAIVSGQILMYSFAKSDL